MILKSLTDLHPIHNSLRIELTKGFYASEGIPEQLIHQADLYAEAMELVDAKLARWDTNPNYGFVLKMQGDALWNEVLIQERIAFQEVGIS